MECRLVLTLVSGLILSAAPDFGIAQTTTGTIDGVVRGPDNVPVPAVRVVANSAALIQQDLTTYSDRTGYYRLSSLPPGEYEVSFTLEGFQPFRRSGLLVRAGQTTSVDIQLLLAPIEETTVVVGESPTIDPRRAKLAFSYTAELAQNIPTSRDFHGLVATVPGVESANNYGVFQPGGIELHNVLGAGTRANSYRLDGANTTDPAQQSNQAALFSYDIIQEVHVVKGAKPAEVGSQGGLFSVVTKSGGNDFSGEAGAYFQTDALQSDNASGELSGAGAQVSNELKDAYDMSASMGGRIVRNKLWWYGSARRQDNTSTLLGFPEEVTSEIDALFWKNTYQVNPEHRLTALANHWDQTVSHFFLDYSPSLARDPQASTFRPIHGDTFSVQWLGTLSDRLLAEASWSTSEQGLDQAFQPGAGVAVIDLVTGERFRNNGSGSRDHDGDNWSWSGTFSWFVPETAGRHDFRFGGEYTPTRVTIRFDDVGDHRLNLIRGRPFAVRLLNTPVNAQWNNNHFSLYAQDAWTIGNRLTLNLGARFDRSIAWTPDQATGGGDFAGTPLAERFPQLNPTVVPQTELIRWNDVAPRLAAVYSLDSSGRTVLRANASRYYHFLESFALFASNPAFPFTFIVRWNDVNGDGAFQIGEEGQLLARFGGALNTVDPDVRRPYTDEFVVGISREPFRDVQLSANFIYKVDKELMNTIDVGVPFDSYRPVQAQDPGDDGVLGTPDDGSLTVFEQDPATLGMTRLVLTNPPDDDRTYKALELTASKRLSDNWQAVASWVISDMEVIKPSNPTSVNGLFDDPNALINARGKDPLNQTHQLKLQGTYFAPYEINISGFYRYASGLPFTRELVVEGLAQGPITVFAEPRGSRTTESSSVLDLRVEKELRLPRALRVGLILDVFNLTNAATVIEEGTRTGVDLGQPRAVRTPRIARLGARVTW